MRASRRANPRYLRWTKLKQSSQARSSLLHPWGSGTLISPLPRYTPAAANRAKQQFRPARRILLDESGVTIARAGRPRLDSGVGDVFDLVRERVAHAVSKVMRLDDRGVGRDADRKLGPDSVPEPARPHVADLVHPVNRAGRSGDCVDRARLDAVHGPQPDRAHRLPDDPKDYERDRDTDDRVGEF